MLAVVVGAEPVFSVVTALPGFSTAHNGRMVIFVLFALAMLAGWGLDELTPARARRERRRHAVLAIAAAAIFCVPFVWMLVAGDARRPSRLGTALKVAWGFADPPPPPDPRATRRAEAGRRIEHRPAERAAPVAPARRRRARR